jgi:hypothetical protein
MYLDSRRVRDSSPVPYGPAISMVVAGCYNDGRGVGRKCKYSLYNVNNC